GAPAVDCAIGFLLLLVVMLCFRLVPGAEYSIAFSPLLLLAPVIIFLTLLAAMGVGILLSALGVAFRDFKYVVPYMIQIGFFVSPVIFPISKFPQRYQLLLYLNPVAGPIEAFRWIVLGMPFSFLGLAISTAVSLVMLLVGVVYFARVEKAFADVA